MIQNFFSFFFSDNTSISKSVCIRNNFIKSIVCMSKTAISEVIGSGDTCKISQKLQCINNMTSAIFSATEKCFIFRA